jgi:16S rRNA (guanine(966)-N(2))-methyltransferase RsmD
VKEAIFNMLGASVVDASVVDLFAGTGGLGIEALSEGANVCWFCDNSGESVALLRRNLSLLGVGTEGRVIHADFRRALREIATRAGGTEVKSSVAPLPGVVDLIFVDPPYERGYYDEVMQILATYDMMSPGGLVVMERAADPRAEERVFPGFRRLKSKRYGHTTVDIYERTEDERQKDALRGYL